MNQNKKADEDETEIVDDGFFLPYIRDKVKPVKKNDNIHLSEWRATVEEVQKPPAQPKGSITRDDIKNLLADGGFGSEESSVLRFINKLKSQDKIKIIQIGRRRYYILKLSK